jgi:ABC-type antimicrobial peptide transport system permease subunit
MLYPRRASAAILGIAGIVGLVLASTGLYGAMSFSVAQRMREIGVRMALGAERRDIARMILREGLTVIVAGLVLGFALAYAAIRLTARLVAPLPPGDVLTCVGGSGAAKCGDPSGLLFPGGPCFARESNRSAA